MFLARRSENSACMSLRLCLYTPCLCKHAALKPWPCVSSSSSSPYIPAEHCPYFRKLDYLSIIPYISPQRLLLASHSFMILPLSLSRSFVLISRTLPPFKGLHVVTTFRQQHRAQPSACEDDRHQEHGERWLLPRRTIVLIHLLGPCSSATRPGLNLDMANLICDRGCSTF
jgi:hypothetical protein